MGTARTPVLWPHFVRIDLGWESCSIFGRVTGLRMRSVWKPTRQCDFFPPWMLPVDAHDGQRPIWVRKYEWRGLGWGDCPHSAVSKGSLLSWFQISHLTPWSSVPLKSLIVAKLVKKFRPPYRTPMPITVFRSVHLSQINPVDILAINIILSYRLVFQEVALLQVIRTELIYEQHR
jgi:hypothetical protein